LIADLDDYFDWYRFTEESRVQFARMRFTRLVRIYSISIEREYTRPGTFIELGRK